MAQGDSTGRRGLDGLTAAELAASRRGLWDEAFTEVLLRRVPEQARKLIDVGCGLASAAHALLPKLPTVTYVGVDADTRRLDEAEKLLVGVPYRERVQLRFGWAENLPAQNAEAEVALTSMTLQHLPDPGAAVRDIARVLTHGGRFITVEPDNTANQVYFDGVLEDVTTAFRDLLMAQRRARRPADIAIGPAVAKIMEQEKFQITEYFPYVLGKVRRMSAKDFFSRMAQAVDIVGASLAPQAPQVAVCRESLSKAESAVGSATMGHGCQFVPVFICVATKP
jgi:ubiquinone/menaquinone biosynthesis C-methylase UbiE